jgi:hypothetical protein
VPVSMKASKKASQKALAVLSGSSELCYSGEVPLESVEVALEMDPVLVPIANKVAMNRSSPEFALASPEMGLTLMETIALVSPVVPSKILVAREVA